MHGPCKQVRGKDGVRSFYLPARVLEFAMQICSHMLCNLFEQADSGPARPDMSDNNLCYVRGTWLLLGVITDSLIYMLMSFACQSKYPM